MGLADLLSADLGDVGPGAGGGVPDWPQAGAGRQSSGLSLSPGPQGDGAKSEKVS